MSKNYLNKNCIFEFPGGTTFNLSALFDNAPFKANNVLVNGQQTLQFIVYFTDDFGQNVNRDISHIILQNHNLASFTVEGLTGRGYVTLYTEIGGAETNSIVDVSGTALGGLRITISATIANKNVIRIGQMRVCNLLFDLVATTEASITPVVDEGSLRTFNGALSSWTNFEKWGIRLRIENIRKEQLDKLKAEIKNEKYITILPWLEWEPKDIYECMIARDSIGSYAVNRWSGLISMTMNLEAKEDAVN